MQPFPHTYAVAADGSDLGNIVLSSEGTADLAASAPKEFGGPGNEWSPESLLVAAAASCFILTFRAVARAAKLEWSYLECAVEGTLDRTDGVTQFTKLFTNARLTVPGTTDLEACKHALKKAERSCLISNSLRAERTLRFDVVQDTTRIATAQ